MVKTTSNTNKTSEKNGGEGGGIGSPIVSQARLPYSRYFFFYGRILRTKKKVKGIHNAVQNKSLGLL